MSPHRLCSINPKMVSRPDNCLAPLCLQVKVDDKLLL